MSKRTLKWAWSQVPLDNMPYMRTSSRKYNIIKKESVTFKVPIDKNDREVGLLPFAKICASFNRHDDESPIALRF